MERACCCPTVAQFVTGCGVPAVADEEHVREIRKGAHDWNEWRQRQSGWLRIDLSGADLKGANLHKANLTGADLRNVDLSNANLMLASLNDTDLTGANLSGASLLGTKLDGSNLIDANLSRARLLKTSFINVDLTTANGLETCQHNGPCVIDVTTLQRSNSLPLVFLRGVGLPEVLINYLHSLFNQAIYYSCFISYSSKDDAFAKRLHADLQNNSVRCWFAPHDLPIGAETRSAIDAEIRVQDKLLLILSEHAISSQWVKDEVEAAYEEESRRGQTVLFPIRLDDAVIDTNEAWAAKLRRQRNIGDFRQWKDHDRYQEAFQRVLRDLKAAQK